MISLIDSMDSIDSIGQRLKRVQSRSAANVLSLAIVLDSLSQDLLQRPLPKAVKLGSVYHLHDLIGADLVEG